MPPDNNPSGNQNQVVRMGDDSVLPVPVKTITLTNNTDHIVYPFSLIVLLRNEQKRLQELTE